MTAGVSASIIPEVQGLRGLTAIAVVLFHMGWLWCGWLGVWVFFVLSGFLITRSLMRGEVIAGVHARLRRFYRSRAARILPVYVFIIAAGVAVLVGQAGLDGRTEQLRFLADVPWLLSGTYNVFRTLPDYEQTRLFGHLWSLSAEEQFYLLFPIAFFCLSRRRLGFVLVGVIAATPVVRVATHLTLDGFGWSAGAIATAIYMLPTNHLDAFAAGALIALAETRLIALRDTVQARRLGVLGPLVLVVLAVVCVIVQNLQRPMPGKDFLTDAFVAKPELLTGQLLVYGLGVSGGAVLLLLILTRSPWVQVLSAPSLVKLGSISFGIYVYHFPLLWLFDGAGQRTMIGALVFFGATLASALLSHRYLEGPARRWILQERRAPGFTPGGSPTSAVRSPAPS